MSDSFEVGNRVKVIENELPYAGTIITYDDTQYKVSVDGLGKVNRFTESDMQLLPGGGSAVDCYWKVDYYNNTGTRLLGTEYVQNKSDATWGAGQDWSTTSGGSATSDVLNHVSSNLILYSAIPLNSYVINAGTTSETLAASIDLDAGGLYLFTTVYSGSYFSNATILAGNTSAVYNATGYDRVACIIRADGTTVTYYRYGDIASNKYSRFSIDYNGTSVDNKTTLTLGSTQQASGSFSAVPGKLYRILTSVGDVTGTFTGGVIVSQNLTGDVGKQNLNTLIVANKDTIAYSSGGTLYCTPVTVYVDSTEVSYLYGQ